MSRGITDQEYQKGRQKIILKYLHSSLPKEEARRRMKEELRKLRTATYPVKTRRSK